MLFGVFAFTLTGLMFTLPQHLFERAVLHFPLKKHLGQQYYSQLVLCEIPTYITYMYTSSQ